MTSYAIIKLNEERKLTKKNLNIIGYTMNPKLKSKNAFIEVNKILISNQKFQQNILNKQFHLAYRRLFTMVMDILESTDASEGDTRLALNEIARMKKILEEKYKQKIDNKSYHAMWRKAEILEQKLKEKLMIQENIRNILQNMTMPVPEKEKGRGR